jgi:hypothetical protein
VDEEEEEAHVSGLLDRQQALQDEAAAVLEDLGLLPLLERVGRPVQVGSVALGLMVARDIDLTVLCPSLDTAAIFDALRPLAGHRRIRELRFRDDTGAWNTDPDYPDGVYWGPSYRSEAGTDWNLDVWFIHEDSRQLDLEHLESLPPKLTPETREAILAITDACLGRTWYSSYGIYTAVLDHGVRTHQQYRAYVEGGSTPS